MDSAQDTRTGQVLACEESFFSALLAADHQTLATILADDFVIVDVMSGQAARQDDLLGAISAGELQVADVRQCMAASAFVSDERVVNVGIGVA